MLLRVYASSGGKEFRVEQHDDDKLSCNCKEYGGGTPHQYTCRHIRDYRKVSATWNPNPFDNLDWI